MRGVTTVGLVIGERAKSGPTAQRVVADPEHFDHSIHSMHLETECCGRLHA